MSEESKSKLRNSKLGKKSSDETKKKLSAKRSGEGNPNFGKHWYNNGVKTVSAYSCPEGFVLGKLKVD
jgi:hypothetical protein